MIISRTPYRLSFFGGGTDYNAWYKNHGGLTIAVALKYYCYISLRRLPPFFEHKHRIVYSKIEQTNNIESINHPSVRACLEINKITDGLEIHYDGDLPSRSGIGSSSSFTVGLLNAINCLKGKKISKKELANTAIYLEQDVLKESVGVQDQIMSATGGFQSITLDQSNPWKTDEISFSKDYMTNLEEHMLFGFSGISRLANEHAKKKIKNIDNNTTHFELKNIHSIALEAKKHFKKQSDLHEIGKLLNESWREKKKLAQGVTNDHIDEIYDVATKNGALGGKLMGAGGGGFFFFIAPPKYHNKIKENLKKIKVWVPFKVDQQGSKIILK